ncbi:uncharacterized protein Tco025E_07872 [Trypanosoma conorhini]|uniref:Uncharacterized protein n=1 Tax=Trypanosoma conorhini TaxID=83891 RepID=A0A3R7MM47_9TRYP|nr:uncharacterized protein Tco025E_07872 [Trypanosoma conorhini]RNF05004.1 hypothetical protein Tco025E_07872 [Trypanosoma conorhini]
MHVEFRISCIEGMCAFDAESFIRMHQLNDRSQQEVEAKRTLVQLPEGGNCTGRKFHPYVKLQLVFENLVCIESSVFRGSVERQQHEKQVKTNWDASEIRTKRYFSCIGEAIVASLPFFVAERYVKIRLIQLAPEFGREELASIKATYPAFLRLQESSLCLGVAKLGMRELLISNGGVSVTLQPKQSMISAVEALNLNTVATKGMFGEDVGGSAVLTVQTSSIVFGQKSLPTLLFPARRNTGGLSAATHAVNAGIGSHDVAETDWGVEKLAELRQQMSSSAVHFVLVPYMVLIHTVLCLNDAVSWRHTARTLLLLCIVLFVFITDVVEIGLILCLVVEAILILRTTVLFYRMPSHVNPTMDAVFPLVDRGDDFQAVLYGCQNHIINGMVRARLFFSQGLQADCYFELVFVFSRMRRARRWLLPCLVTTLVASLVFSVETLFLLFILAAFLIHPLTLRVPPSHLRKIWRRRLPLRVIWKALTLCRPMRVSRLVLVTDVGKGEPLRRSSLSATPFVSPSPTRSLINFPAATQPHPMLNDADTHCGTVCLGVSPDKSSGQSRHAGERGPFSRVNSQTARFLGNSAAGEKSTLSAAVAGNHFQSHCASPKMFSWSCGETLKYDAQHNPLLNLALIVITTDAMPASSNKVNTSGNNGGNSLIVQKLRRVLQRARTLERPPPSNLQREQYQAYFSCVVPFLQFLRRQCTLRVYVTPSSSLTSSPTSDTGNMVRLDQLANLSYLVDKGEDDGITSTLLAHSSQQVVLGKLSPLDHIDSSARGFALLAAYVLQGSRFSIYNRPGNKGCGMIIPLKVGSNDIEVAPEPHPCPPSLQKALIDIWKGWADGEPPIFINTDVVMNIIATHKEFWGSGDTDAMSAKDYKNMMALQEYGETARDTSKRILSTFSAPSFGCKRQRVTNASGLNPEPSPALSAVGGQKNPEAGPSLLDEEKSSGTLGIFSGRPQTFHHATRSWAYSTPTLQCSSQRQRSVPRLSQENTSTMEEIFGATLPSREVLQLDGVPHVGAGSSTPGTK